MERASTFSLMVAKKHSLDENFRRKLWAHLNKIPRGRDTWPERKIFFNNLLEDREFAIKVVSPQLDGTLELEELTGDRASPETVEKALEIFFSLVAKLKPADREPWLRNYCNYRPKMLGKVSAEERSRYKANEAMKLFSSLPKEHFEEHIWKYLKQKKLPPLE